MQKMEARAVSKYVKMAPNKIRRVLNQIRGKTCSEALLLLKYMPYASCAPITKVLCSAKANAKANLDFDVNEKDLIVKYAFVDQGPTRKKVRARARGKAYRILKRTSHITIVIE